MNEMEDVKIAAACALRLAEMTAMNLWLGTLVVVLSCCEAYKILVIFPVPSRSHGNLGDGIVRNLLKEGHEVTYISAFPYKPASPNLRLVDVSADAGALPGHIWTIEAIMNKKIDFTDHLMLITMMTDMIKFTVKNENVQRLLNDPKETFDAVIVEWVFTELPAGFASIFDCPLIWVSTLDIHWAILKLIDQPSNPAYTGDAVSAFTPPFTFWQRVVELYTQIKVLYLEYMYLDKLQSEAYDDLFAPLVIKRGRQPPAFKDILYNASLVLSNSHLSLGQAISIPQNYIPVGGYHIEEDVKPLPDNLENIMDDATTGVIYFSMGSNLKSMDIPKEIRDGMLRMFGELNQTVMWKFEDDLLDVPRNVHILKWAPQTSILSHPNTVLFITHGGCLSTTEAIHFGVPIIGIPVFGDQFVNIGRSVNKGFARRVDLSFTMVSELKSAIEELITNPRYKEKAKELSFIYHDRPAPGKVLVQWVKHVIETRGALHLRSPALNVPLYQKLYLDLLGFIILVLFVSLALLKCTYSLYYFTRNVYNNKIKVN